MQLVAMALVLYQLGVFWLQVSSGHRLGLAGLVLEVDGEGSVTVKSNL